MRARASAESAAAIAEEVKYLAKRVAELEPSQETAAVAATTAAAAATAAAERLVEQKVRGEML